MTSITRKIRSVSGFRFSHMSVACGICCLRNTYREIFFSIRLYSKKNNRVKTLQPTTDEMYCLTWFRSSFATGVFGKPTCTPCSICTRKILQHTTATKSPGTQQRNNGFPKSSQDSGPRHDLQKRLLQWDERLPVPAPPSLGSLVEFLVRRRTPSSSSNLRRGFERLLARSACRILGLHSAQKGLCDNHFKDPINNCWYSPSNRGDTFGIRHDEIYFHELTPFSQPLTSYAILIRGSPCIPGSVVEGGIGQNPKAFVEYSSPNNEGSMVDRAASLVCGLLQARDFYLSDEFAQDTIKKVPLTMQWYSYIFSCSMQFVPGCFERYKAPASHSRHIIVMVRGNMYKVDLLLKDNEGKEKKISFKQLKEQLQYVVDLDAAKKPSTPIAVLTSITPGERCQEEQRLKSLSECNVNNLALIRDALFVVALDPDDSPRTANEAMFALYSGNFMNRWYDKSVQLVVFRNGVAGFVNNYLAGMTGTVGTSFVQIAVKSELTMKEEEQGCSEVMDWPCSPSALEWDDSTEGHFKQKIDSLMKASRTTGAFKPLSKDVFKICLAYSFEAMCKAHRVIPGGAFHAGLQLSLAKISGKFMSVNEVVSIRNFRFGGMTFMDSSMADMRVFVETAQKSGDHVENMTKEERMTLRNLLRLAIQSYKDEVQGFKRGEMNTWHLDSLYRNVDLPNRLPFRNSPRLNLITRLRQVVLNSLRSPLLNVLPAPVAENVTSNPSWYPEIEAIGRPGVKCVLPPTSMALHYMLGKNAISMTVNANPQHPCYQREEEFVEELERSLEFVKDLLEAK